eukprot:14395157-Alexandrium_andersonii.AAC.1
MTALAAGAAASGRAGVGAAGAPSPRRRGPTLGRLLLPLMPGARPRRPWWSLARRWLDRGGPRRNGAPLLGMTTSS